MRWQVSISFRSITLNNGSTAIAVGANGQQIDRTANVNVFVGPTPAP
jgi:hypothetical protein